jgi:hypothetical protein
MHYSDLVHRTASLPPGPHVIYDLSDGKVEIRNLGVRHHDLSPLPEFRLFLRYDGREMMPRHADFFSDYLLKIETRPELRLPLTEACEQVCNGLAPSGIMASKHLPKRFSEVGESTASLQISMDQSAGLPTELFLCGLQGLIRVFELNRWLDNPPEAFRQAFLGLEKGQPFVEVIGRLQPQIRPAKYYFDRTQRPA